MKVIRHVFNGVKTGQWFRIVFVGDIHLGANACDERKLRGVLSSVERDPDSYIVSMGDIIDGIKPSDPRFDPRGLADWIGRDDLPDILNIQKQRAVDYFGPVADKILCMASGNHEYMVEKHSQRDIHMEIVDDVSMRRSDGRNLDIGPYGWVQLVFRRSGDGESPAGTEIVNIVVFHGSGGGKMAGGKANNMQRWLWIHDADICAIGHVHATISQVETVRKIDRSGKVRTVDRYGIHTGTFLKTSVYGHSTYSEKKGYYPTPVMHTEALIRPHGVGDRRIKIVMG